MLTFSHSGSRIQGPKRHPIPDPGSATLLESFSSSCLDESDVELGESVAEEERPEVVLLEQELQHVQTRLLVAPVHTRPCNAEINTRKNLCCLQLF
jgi:hypothetical protein